MRNVVGSSDIVVIGAGIVGCAIAHALAGRGASVSILDPREPGAGATQASGGMLAPYSEAGESRPLLELGIRSLGLFDRLVASLESETGIDVGYHRTGTLHVARAQRAVAPLTALADELSSLGVVAERLSSGDVRRYESNLAADVCGGLFIPAQGLVSAPAITRALLAAAERRGAILLPPARATRIRARDAGVELETDRGRVHADAAVLAAGAWSSEIDVEGADRHAPVKPVRGQLLHLRWQGTPVARITWDERCYTIPWSDGTLLVGATVEDAGYDERTTVAGVRDLLDAVCDLLPNASTASLLSARVGLRPGSADPLPIIGWSAAVPRLMYATGHYRNGVLLAPLTAELVARAMIDREHDDALRFTDPARFGGM